MRSVHIATRGYAPYNLRAAHHIIYQGDMEMRKFGMAFILPPTSSFILIWIQNRIGPFCDPDSSKGSEFYNDSRTA